MPEFESGVAPKAREGKKLWLFWIFGLGFFSGFLIALVVAEKLNERKLAHSEVPKAEPAEVVTEKSHAEPAAEEPGPRAPESHEAMKETEHGEVVLSKAARDRLLTFDFLQLLQDADIHRYRYEGETRGIVLTKIRTGSIYEKVGFEDGDIIEQINGIAIADIEHRAGEMKEKLPMAERVEFTVRRDERKVKLKVRVAAPAGR